MNDNVECSNCKKIEELTDRIKRLEEENIVMYAAILEAADLGSKRCLIELQRIARNDAKGSAPNA